MSDDTRYGCCKHCLASKWDGQRWACPSGAHVLPCPTHECRGAVPVGPTKEGKQ